LEEAALGLGAGRWSTFRRVTMPLMMPGIYAGVLYAFIVSFGDVSVSLFLAGPRFTTFPVEIFQALGFDFNPAMLAISTLVALFSLGITWVIQQILGLDILLRAGARE
jgi:putative spermidine/putrescine transport system permease protein